MLRSNRSRGPRLLEPSDGNWAPVPVRRLHDRNPGAADVRQSIRRIHSGVRKRVLAIVPIYEASREWRTFSPVRRPFRKPATSRDAVRLRFSKIGLTFDYGGGSDIAIGASLENVSACDRSLLSSSSASCKHLSSRKKEQTDMDLVEKAVLSWQRLNQPRRFRQSLCEVSEQLVCAVPREYGDRALVSGQGDALVGSAGRMPEPSSD